VDKGFIPALIAAAVSGALVVIGWFVLNALSRRREIAAQRDIAARVYLENQIEQLYGPLLGLIQYSRMAFSVAAKKLATDVSGRIDFSRFSALHSEIWHFFIESYFLPVNSEIRQLIRSKMHLLESGILPKSFEDFFRHEVQFEALHRLWKEKGVESPEISGPGWPNDFESDVKTVLDRLRLRHEFFLQRLGASGHKGEAVD
jgi:hypothetical protein